MMTMATPKMTQRKETMSRVEIYEQESKIRKDGHGDITTTATLDGPVWGIS